MAGVSQVEETCNLQPATSIDMAKIGIIGTGWGARTQVPLFREAGLEVVAIAGSRPDKTRQVASDLKVDAFDDWRKLASDPSIDLVSIVTPPSRHLEMSIFALRAGKHVVSEKPTAMNVAEAEQMLAESEKYSDRIAIIDHELRFLPAWRSAREHFAQIGPMRYAEARFSSPGRADRKRVWNWWSDREQGGGVWGAVGSHFVDALRYFGGEVRAIRGSLHTFIKERPFEGSTRKVTSDDFAVVDLELGGGGRAGMTFSVVATVDEPTALVFHGERGGMRLIGESLETAEPSGSWKRIEGEDLAKRPGNSSGGAFGTGTLYLGRALFRALNLGDRDALAPAATFRDGLQQQRVLDAARRSDANGGRWETVES